MKFPPDYRQAEVSTRSCNTCEYFSPVSGGCRKYNIVVKPDTVCSQWEARRTKVAKTDKVTRDTAIGAGIGGKLGLMAGSAAGIPAVRKADAANRSLRTLTEFLNRVKPGVDPAAKFSLSMLRFPRIKALLPFGIAGGTLGLASGALAGRRVGQYQKEQSSIKHRLSKLVGIHNT